MPPSLLQSARSLGAAACLACAAAAHAQVETLVSPTPNTIVNSEFGMASGTIPDVNGDGVDDILIGAQQEFVLGSDLPSGRVHIFCGASRTILRTVSIPDPQPNNWVPYFGQTVTGLADRDGDGFGDLAVAAPGHYPPPGISVGGRIHVFSGATGEWLFQILADPVPATPCGMAKFVHALPDLDGDGLEDLGVGFDGLNCTYFYRAYSTATLQPIIQPVPYLLAVKDAVALADLDGDGVPEIALGVHGAREFTDDPHRGRVYIVSGATGALVRTLRAPGETSSGFGNTLDRIGDLDGDGVPDLIVGAYQSAAPGAPTLSGLAHVYSGLTGELLHTLAAPVPQYFALFGAEVVAQNDLDGDGREDILVTAFMESPPGLAQQAGAAYLFSGATGKHLRTLHSPNPELRGRLGFRAGRMPEHRPHRRATIGVGAPYEWGNRGRYYLFAACRADTNADGLINSRDITHFLTGWLTTAASPPGTLPPPGVHSGDYNDDGLVTSADISDFLTQWLAAIAENGCP